MFCNTSINVHKSHTLFSVGGNARSLVISSQVAVQNGYGKMEKHREDVLVTISFQFPLVGYIQHISSYLTYAHAYIVTTRRVI